MGLDLGDKIYVCFPLRREWKVDECRGKAAPANSNPDQPAQLSEDAQVFLKAVDGINECVAVSHGIKPPLQELL